MREDAGDTSRCSRLRLVSLLVLVSTLLLQPSRSEAVWCQSLASCSPVGKQLAMLTGLGRSVLWRDPEDERECGFLLDVILVRRQDSIACLQSQSRQVTACQDQRLTATNTAMANALEQLAAIEARRRTQVREFLANERPCVAGCLSDAQWSEVWGDDWEHLPKAIDALQSVKSLIASLVAAGGSEISDGAWYDMQVSTSSSCDAKQWSKQEKTRKLAGVLCEINKILSIKQVGPSDEPIVW